jgi:predicted ATP-grasp superfamily ATP-dependent carboligase
MTLPTTRVLVLDANQRSALAVTRSLGRAGLATILAADSSPEALAGCSRHSEHYARCPSPAQTPALFLEWLSAHIKAHAIDWVFPTTEITSQLILSEPAALGDARIPFAPLETVMALADKWALVQLARRIGVPHPSSIYYANAAALLGSADALTFPVVLKPCQSRRWLGDHWLNTSVHVAHNADELYRLLNDKVYLRDFPFMAQQFIAGHGAGVFALYDRGKPVTFFAHRRLREKPPRGGVSVLSESAAIDPAALHHTRTLLDAVNWHGVAMVEFRVAEDGTPYLMEVNTRFWGSLQLAIDAGVDFPTLLFRVANGETVTPVTDYRSGQRLRWLLGDLDSLYLVLRDSGFSTADKLRRLLDFLTPHPFSTRHEVNRWDDLGPAWCELKGWLRALKG